MEDYSPYEGLDVHTDKISVAVAWPGRSKAEYRGIIPNTMKPLMKLVNRLSRNGEALLFCYEAGPCGYDIYRWILDWGHDCQVVAPSLVVPHQNPSACEIRDLRAVPWLEITEEEGQTARLCSVFSSSSSLSAPVRSGQCVGAEPIL